MKKNLNEEIRRTKEIMGLLNEQTIAMNFHVFKTCDNDVHVAPVQNPNSLMNATLWNNESNTFYAAMQSPSPGDVVVFDTPTDVTSQYQDAVGKCVEYVGISSCQAPSSGGPFSPQPPTCTMHFGGAIYAAPTHLGNCIDCAQCVTSPANCIAQQVIEYDCIAGSCQAASPGTYNAGPTSQDNLNACQAACGSTGPFDCRTGAPDYTSQQWGTSVDSFFNTCDQKEALAMGGNPAGCNWICNKRNALLAGAPYTPGNINHDRKQCKLDYVQDAANNVPCNTSNSGPCTSSTGSGGINQAWIDDRIENYDPSFNNKGCCGNPAQWSCQPPYASGVEAQPASLCGKKDQFCPGTTPTQQAKCDWLTDYANGIPVTHSNGQTYTASCPC